MPKDCFLIWCTNWLWMHAWMLLHVWPKVQILTQSYQWINYWYFWATLLDTWCYRDSARTGWPSVCILWPGDMACLIFNLYLSVGACKTAWADRAQKTSIFHLHIGHCGLSAHSKRTGISDSPLGECRQADQTPDHVFQSCPKYAKRQQLTWTHSADLVNKLWGSAEDLYWIDGFVASTWLKIWPAQLLIAEEEDPPQRHTLHVAGTWSNHEWPLAMCISHILLTSFSWSWLRSEREACSAAFLFLFSLSSCSISALACLFSSVSSLWASWSSLEASESRSCLCRFFRSSLIRSWRWDNISCLKYY